MLISGMTFPLKYCRFMVIGVCAVAAGAAGARGQNPPTPQPTILDRLNAMTSGGKSAWTDEQIHTMERLRDAAMKSDYAYDELRHLTNNIGPRLSGSPQVQYYRLELAIVRTMAPRLPFHQWPHSDRVGHHKENNHELGSNRGKVEASQGVSEEAVG